jgi:hypothetical protein
VETLPDGEAVRISEVVAPPGRAEGRAGFVSGPPVFAELTGDALLELWGPEAAAPFFFAVAPVARWATLIGLPRWASPDRIASLAPERAGVGVGVCDCARSAAKVTAASNPPAAKRLAVP